MDGEDASTSGSGFSGKQTSTSSLESLGNKILALSSEIVSRSPLVRALLACLGFLGALGILYESWARQRFGLAHWVLFLAFVGYAYFTEARRIPRKKKEVQELRKKCRKLVQARRAAGLLRLEKDTRLRREHWPAPPHSGLKAYLYKESSIDLDAMSVESPMKRKLDYKRLCTQIVRELLFSSREGEGARGEGARSLFRLLSQAGVEPVKDPELYRDMHLALDEVERQLKRNASADKEQATGFYCRLCLGFQNKGGSVTLKCKHKICKECSLSLVESSLSGAIGVPISCPVGCNSLMSPHMMRSSLNEETFERFQRIHTVKMSLQASAPHVRSLASELAEARKGLAKSRERRDSKESNANAKGGNLNELKLRTSIVNESSSSGSRFADPMSRLNHRTRLK
ncbi:hypothetical protein HOP50_11g61610 [Chloropicon primus]|uniref:RING-type domain-containing protein n=1 Tax=Chloropicon primus TaxID=1764295 RepID=A0A5B8MTA3_9CHLO|nr:hypothetical protein A3770_11p61390 [Chloropicon primus]UPR02834.1 hypothetical protein HOP50_11g61610 [Chloropicon primus]|eukprot:QDZ23621.1 hypothetical protein A3770_11p61390 [Chloropicon primus]